MIDILLSNGDKPEADTPEEAVYAARTMMQEASAAGTALRLLTATFHVGTRYVRSGVRYSELTTIEKAVT